MLIAEELLLLALDPDKGRVPSGSRDYLKIGLSGALLAELAVEGRLVIAGKKLGIVEPPVDIATPIDDPLLARALALLTGELAGQSAKRTIKRVDKRLGGVWSILVDRLIDEGVIGREKRSALTATRHPVLDIARHAAIVANARAAASGDGPLSPRDAVILAFSGPCRLLERVAPERSDRRHAKARIAEATKVAPLAPTVKALIDELIAAGITVVAVAAATSAG
jgi:Golgi phosphoprotein 3 (GPP34)